MLIPLLLLLLLTQLVIGISSDWLHGETPFRQWEILGHHRLRLQRHRQWMSESRAIHGIAMYIYIRYI